MAVHDAAVTPFGLRTSCELRCARPGQADIGFFPVLSGCADEIVLWEAHRHLDFRLSRLRQAEPHGSMQIATSVASTHNRLDGLHLRAVHPFHSLVVRATLVERLPEAERTSGSGAREGECE